MVRLQSNIGELRVTRALVMILVSIQGFIASAHADTPTGNVEQIVGFQGACTSPPASSPSSWNVYVVSEFQYLACKEYFSAATQTVYSRLENARNGQSIRLLARAGEAQLDPTDYQNSVAAAVSTCNQIRETAVNHALTLDKSKCADQVYVGP